MNIILRGVLLFAFTLSITFTVSANQTEPTKKLTFGVFPYLPAPRLEAVFAPIAAEVSATLKTEILYQSSSTFEKFVTRLENEEFDIAFIQPFDYIQTAANHGYTPIVRRKEALQGVFVVNEQSPLHNLNDLSGKTVAMAPEIAALSYLGKIRLAQIGLVPHQDINVKHFRGHHSCLQQVVIGQAEACVTGLPAMRMFENLNKVKLRILGQTETAPAMLFVVHSRIPADKREQIRQALLLTELKNVDPNLKTLLKKEDQQAFVPTIDSDYDHIRALLQQFLSKDN